MNCINGSLLLGLAILMLLIIPVNQFAQGERVKWKRSETTETQGLQLFHSTQAVNLPTTETLQKGNFEFEISHRFIPRIKDGVDELYGFDGPVNMRLALGYAPSDRMIITLGRSNYDDNVDLWIKYKTFELKNKVLPAVVALRAGAAWNTQVEGRSSGNTRNFQYYGQAIINTMISKKFAIGIVPSYLHNSYITSADVQYSFTMGANIQYYVSSLLSVLGEWNPTVTGFRVRNNPLALGIELETGGHFFKIVITNSIKLNPSQFLAGAEDSVNDGNWRIGFNITRLLNF